MKSETLSADLKRVRAHIAEHMIHIDYAISMLDKAPDGHEMTATEFERATDIPVAQFRQIEILTNVARIRMKEQLAHMRRDERG